VKLKSDLEFMDKLRCAITGANGYLGSMLCNSLNSQEIVVIPISRGDPVKFNLHRGLDLGYFKSENINCLIHCAWDFNIRNDQKYELTNLGGAIGLFKTAKEAGVKKLIFISSMSAFENCKSRYGMTKYKTEIKLLAMGVIVIRPGLVYGDKLNGILGALARLIRNFPIIPIIGGEENIQYTAHEEDLSNLTKEIILSPNTLFPAPIVAASKWGLSLRGIMDVISHSMGSNPVYILVPWKLVWVILGLAEKIHLNLPLKSDSVIGLVYSNPNPNFDGLDALKTKFRLFEL